MTSEPPVDSEEPVSSEEMLRRARESARSPESPEIDFELTAPAPPQPSPAKVTRPRSKPWARLEDTQPQVATNARPAIVAAMGLLVLAIVVAAVVALVASSP